MKNRFNDDDYEFLEEDLYNFEDSEVTDKKGSRKESAKKRDADVFTVKEPSLLLDFLLTVFKGKSRTTIKSYLSHRQIRINDIVCTKFDKRLNSGDRVSMSAEKGEEEFRHSMLRIIYEDNDIIVIDKRNGLLTMATNRESIKTAYYILSQYLKSKDSRNRIFIVHRLDRETSGLLMFAKSMEIQHRLQQNWSELVLERKYIAVVSGRMPQESGEIVSYLAENKMFHVYSTKNKEEGELAITKYEVLSNNGKYSLVELELETGKKNQIRVHMKDVGCSIVGDRKYGGIVSPIGRIALHAKKLRFRHPVTDRELCFDTGIPRDFSMISK